MADIAQQQAVFSRYFSPDKNVVAVDSSSALQAASSEKQIFARFFASAPAAANDAIAQSSVEPAVVKPAVESIAVEQPHIEETAERPVSADVESRSFFKRVRSGLSRTRSSFTKGMSTLLIGKKEIDDELFEDIETQLLVSDVGVEATTRIIDALTDRVSRQELYDSDALYVALQEELRAILSNDMSEFVVDTSKKPYVILMVGVNGVGKTTTIGKLAKRLQSEGKTVMLAAGDTFRAAAVEQLQVWGARNDIPVIAQHQGADSASVVFDAMQAAQARNVDVLIADTAGRLHNKSNLMDELEKVRRVLGKLDSEAPHEVMLVLDAGTGQNALNQVQTFNDAVDLSAITLTKLDGTAKGGVVFSLAAKTDVPIKFIGVGEQIDDLRPFDPDEFVQALFDEDQ
ncbi:signal recognition particle-docking protein FtsY [Gammaproteobacteria bacterium 45_16_T64]|nr:signal recognition particle-docking protein FtsY [Gammaproteobacteria bacterium 45_16_T64]